MSDDYLLRPVSGQPGKLEPIPMSPGEVHVWGEAVVTNGDTVFRARNKIVGQGLRSLINCIQNLGGNFVVGSTTGHMRVGTGSGATGDGTTALVTENTTAPNTVNISLDNPSSGVYRFKFVATWNAGTLPAITVTEIAIKGNVLATLGSGSATANGLFARLSVTDSEFSSFVVNTAAPLTIEYRVVMTFA